MTFIIDKLKTYALHFAVSCLIILAIAGFIKYNNDVRNLNEQIYLASQSHGTMIVSEAPKKTIVDVVLDRHKLPAVSDIPPSQVKSVVEVQTSTNCPNVDITLLKDGRVVSESSGVTKILVENRADDLFYNKLDIRIAGIGYPKQGTHDWKGDLGVQVAYWHVWRFQPDLTVSSRFIGGGLSYAPNIPHLENLVFGGGYGYRFDENFYSAYGSASLRLGRVGN